MMSPFRKIFIAQYKVDMRKSFDGLYAESRRHQIKLWDGEGMVFVGRNKRIVKILGADSTGIIIVAKRFTSQCIRTRLQFLTDPTVKTITKADLEMLLEGKDYEVKRQPRGWVPAELSRT